MIRLGLCSGACITRDVPEVIKTAARAGLDAIEWETNLHVAAGDLRSAEETMMATLQAGLTTASLASIYGAGGSDEGHKRFGTLLATASAMHAPLLRIYVSASVAELRDLASELTVLGDLAAEKGITLCLSFGRKTFLDHYDRARSLLAAVRHDFVKLAWEDLPGTLHAEATTALEDFGRAAGLLVARCAAKDGSALPLAREAEAWRERLRAFKLSEPDPKMGSFVFLGATRAEGQEGEDSLSEDAGSLRSLIEELEPRKR